MPLRALLLVTEQPQAGSSNHLKHNSIHDKHGSALLSPINHGSASRPLSLRSSITGFFPNTASSEPRGRMANTSTLQSSRVSLPQSDADLGPDTTRSSVHSPTLSLLQTTSGTDYAASSPPHSPPPVPSDVLSTRVPTPYTHLIRAPPEPEPPPELDEKGRPKLRLKTKFPAVGTALRYYKHVSGDDDEMDEMEGIPPGEMEERGETEEGKRSKLKMDWKTNPRAKPGKRKDEDGAKNPLYAPTRVTPPVRFVREEDQFANWLDEDAFWAGKSIPKVQFGWWKRSAVEIVEILTKAETKRERKDKFAAASAAAHDGIRPNHKHEPSFDENAPLPTIRMTELTATHHRTPVACMAVGANWQFPIPVTHLTHEQLAGLATRGLLVVALPPGQNAADWGVEMLSTVPTAGPWDDRDRHAATRDTRKQKERESVAVPILAVVPPSPLLVSPPNANEANAAGSRAIKEGFNSLFSRAKNAREQFLKPTAHPTTTTSSPASSYSSSTPSSPPSMTISTSDMSVTDVSLSPSIPSSPSVPSSPHFSYGSAEARKSIDALSVRSSDTVASTSTASGGSRTSQWVSWASSKWGRS